MKGVALAVYKTHGTFHDGFYVHIFLNSEIQLHTHAFLRPVNKTSWNVHSVKHVKHKVIFLLKLATATPHSETSSSNSLLMKQLKRHDTVISMVANLSF